MKTFLSSTGNRIQTSDKKEIKRLRACGFKQIKTTKIFFAKGLEDGKNFIN